MARRRYLSTDISLDARIAELAMTAGDFAALLYSWLIPHAEDTAEVVGSAAEILYRVMPARRDKTTEDIDDALYAMETLGLVVWDGSRVSFPPDAFYKYQTYIKPDKRRSEHPTPANAEERRKTPKNAASLSVSVSSSISPSALETDALRSARDPYPDDFEEFWQAYPNSRGKKAAAGKFRARRREGVTADELTTAARNYALEVRRDQTEAKFVMHAKTFLGPQRCFEDYVAGIPQSAAGAIVPKAWDTIADMAARGTA